MIQRGWTKRAVLKYTLLEIPPAILFALFLWLIRIWTGLPLWVLYCLLGLWLAKDLVLFFFTWPAYDEKAGDRFSLVDLTGVAEEPLDPVGYIRIRGERWQARPAPDIPVIQAGERVRVLTQEGLTLIVTRDQGQGSRKPTNGPEDKPFP